MAVDPTAVNETHERRSQLSAPEYEQELADIHADLMPLGEWWKGREDEMFQ